MFGFFIPYLFDCGMNRIKNEEFDWDEKYVLFMVNKLKETLHKL